MKKGIIVDEIEDIEEFLNDGIINKKKEDKMLKEKVNKWKEEKQK